VLYIRGCILSKNDRTYLSQKETVTLNGVVYNLKFVRSLGLNERPEVRMNIADTTLKARLYYRRYPSKDEFQCSVFSYKVYPINPGL